MAIRTSDVRSAAERVSSAPNTYSRGAGGIYNQPGQWALTQARVARTLVSDPDIILYMAFLCSNRVAKRTQDVVKALDKLIPLVEGWKYEQPAVGSDARLRRAYTRAAGRAYVDSTELAALQAEVDRYVSKELVPAISSKGRHQVKGTEARSKYGLAKRELLAAWKKLKKGLLRCGEEPRWEPQRARELSVAVPLQNMGKTLSTGFSAEKATEFTLQLAAASASVQALGREVDYRMRFQVDDVSAFPEGLTVSATSSGGFVTEITPSTPPKLLRVRSGDEVTWGAGTATVISVGESSFTLGSSTITSTTGRLTVAPAAYSGLRQLVEVVSTRDAALPSVEQLNAQFLLREEFSAAHIKALVAYLSGLYAQLTSLSTAVSSVNTRLGVEVDPVDAPLLAALTDYSPSFSSKTTKAGDKLLDALEDEGSDYAAQLLLEGNSTRMLNMDPEEASKLGKLSDTVDVLHQYTGGPNGLG